MAFKPLKLMWERIDRAREDSDVALFHNLMYGSEMVLKLIVAGLVAAITEERTRQQYRQMHRLVRAVGLKDWSIVADQVLLGPPSQSLQPATFEEQRQLTQKDSAGTWQHESVTLLHSCLELLAPGREKLPDRLDGRRWLDLCTQVRNKVAHGAPPPELCGRLCVPLEQSLRLVCDHFALFKRPWAHLRRNQSGSYRVIRLGGDISVFDHLKKVKTENLADGAYVHLDGPTCVPLLLADPETDDYLLPNGGFSERQFEMLSYLTGKRALADSQPYLIPAQESLPVGGTHPLGLLEVQGNCFGNLPQAPKGYVARPSLEDDLHRRLTDDNHPIVTLNGPGGIGKTSLALRVLHRIAQEQRFDVILWFSARDIDLLPEGPKPVQPQVLTEIEIAEEFVRLLNLPADRAKKPTQQLADALTRSPVGAILFVFDNFETVRNPRELYTWIDTHQRLPNKVLITTRSRDFKGDYPVEVAGMTEEECQELINTHARQLGIIGLMTPRIREHLCQESAGHPYVIKVVLGEWARLGTCDRVERIMSNKDDILSALFERTYASLSPGAQRVFLTLSAWRVIVAQLALEAVLLRPANERIEVADAIDELERSSMVERQLGGPDADVFLSVPLSAVLFGQRKLRFSPHRAAVEADLQLLRAFGVGRRTDLHQGVRPRIEYLFRAVETQVALAQTTLEVHLPMLEYVARHHPPGWLRLADLHEGLDRERGLERATEAVRRYLELAELMGEDAHPASWQRLADLCRRRSDRTGEAAALIEMCRLPDAGLEDRRRTAGSVLALLQNCQSEWEVAEKRVWARQLVEVLEPHAASAAGLDCALLAELYWRLGKQTEAENWTHHALERDARNPQTLKMKQLLGI